ncbi:DUF6716 putative glycosyltransferase [Streptomyces boninensis]|uniref:DUF6716 putative glycosyltransferase n=1 Tax=Streptomyces boninensis TaxID=2039455 RepID=UPI003B20CD15
MIADSDTRWKWGAATARRIAPGGSLGGYLLRGRATPTVRQLDEVGLRADFLREVTGPEFVREARRDRYDAVILACVGGAVQALLHGLKYSCAADASRPALVTGYVGVVYEKLADGLVLRHGADLVLANSRHDAERFRAVYEGLGAASGSVTECALPFLGGAPYKPAESAEDRPYTVVFAVQPSVPDNRADRLHLLKRAAAHAKKHPDREVLIKLRSRPGEHTTHIEELPYQRLAAKLPGGLPANCRLAYGHMGGVLDRTDLLVTVSSTAALEALHRGVPTAVLTDLGVREVLGNHHFLGSGLLASWDDLDAGHVPEPDAEWVRGQGVTPGASDAEYERAFDAARDRVAGLVRRDALPPLAPYYTPSSAPGYVPKLLARYGFGPDGAPLPGAFAAPDATESALRRASRDVVRRAARGAYRGGVQRVAPLIRRLGAL